MSTNQEAQRLIDEAVALLRQTTVGYAGRTPAWYANKTTRWWQGLDRLAQARALLDPPAAGFAVAPPVGPYTVIDGEGTRAFSPAAFVRTALPATIRKLDVRNMTEYGVGSQQWYPPKVATPGRTLIEDCIVEHVAAVPPLSSNGTSEACAWIGNPSDVRRLRLTDGAWMGMWTGSRCIGSVIEDVTIEGPGVGLYCEHTTKDSTFRRFKIATDGPGIVLEWWYRHSPGPYVGDGEMQGTSGCVFEDMDIFCPTGDDKTSGIFADAGTFGCVFRRIRFWGPGVGIRMPDPNHPAAHVIQYRPNVIEDCVFDQDGPDVVYHRRAIGWEGS